MIKVNATISIMFLGISADVWLNALIFETLNLYLKKLFEKKLYFFNIIISLIAPKPSWISFKIIELFSERILPLLTKIFCKSKKIVKYINKKIKVNKIATLKL